MWGYRLRRCGRLSEARRRMRTGLLLLTSYDWVMSCPPLPTSTGRLSEANLRLLTVLRLPKLYSAVYFDAPLFDLTRL